MVKMKVAIWPGLVLLTLCVVCCDAHYGYHRPVSYHSPPVSTPTNCGTQKKDIAFVWDESGSVTDAEFALMRQFWKDLVDMYTINTANGIQIGSVSHGGFLGPLVNFLLNSNGDSGTVVKNMLDAVVNQVGLTNTKKQLQAVREQIFAGLASGDRPDAGNIVFLITCGVSVDPAGAIAEANLLRAEDNAEIYVIAIAVTDLTEAQGIASDPDSTHLITLDNFAALSDTLPILLAAACDDCIPVCLNNGVCDRPNSRCVCSAPFGGTRCELQLFQTCIFHHSCGGVTTGQYASCGSCRNYVTCVNGHYRGFYCPGSSVYNAVTGACVTDTGSVCSVFHVKPANPPTAKPFNQFLFPSFHNGNDFNAGCLTSCSGMQDGLYHSCASCSQYIACTNQLTAHKSCGWLNEWDDHSKSCRFISHSCHSSLFNFNFGSSSNGYGSNSGGYGSGSSGGYGIGSSGGHGSGSPSGHGSGSSNEHDPNSGYGNFFNSWW